MGEKIAVAIIHGIGNQEESYAKPFIKSLEKKFKKMCKQNGYPLQESPLEIELMYWAPIVQHLEKDLLEKIKPTKLGWENIRKFIITYMGDLVAYTSSIHLPNNQPNISDSIHKECLKTLRKLAESAGDSAPLVIISHSLGTVIARNFIYELQANPSPYENLTKLQQGHTLASLYTLGSPLALWSLSYDNLYLPIKIPSPHLQEMYPSLTGSWRNFYFKNDVLAYPLESFIPKENTSICDFQVNHGPFLINTTPLIHSYYWKNKEVLNDIASTLFHIWKNAKST